MTETTPLRTPHESYLTAGQVCESLKISRTSLWRMLRGGKLPYIQVGSVRRFDLAELTKALHAPNLAAEEETGHEVRSSDALCGCRA
jgi:excisionase family DNA binding protein